MPKLKTNRAAAKRFRKTAKGYKAYSAGRRHNLGHKPRKNVSYAPAAARSCTRAIAVGSINCCRTISSLTARSKGARKWQELNVA
jgi:large subunit ribosomal protein L35